MTDLLTDTSYGGQEAAPGSRTELEVAPSPDTSLPSQFYNRLVDGIIYDSVMEAEGKPETAIDQRQNEIFRLERNPESYEVHVESDVTLADYQAITNPADWSMLVDWSESVSNKSVVFINPTMEGGGVAMMRPPVVHLLNQLGVDAHWYVMQHIQNPDDGEPFVFTKLMHNIMQRKTDERITNEGIALHQQWADQENGSVLDRQETILNADFIVIDDPQPAPLIGRLKEANPSAKFIWRNHIDTDGELMSDPNTPQGQVASYLLDVCGVRGVDAVLNHPVQSFVHPELDDKTYFSPATLETFDNLNRHLNEKEIVAGINFINNEIGVKNQQLLADGRQEDVQPLLSLDPNRQRITLIARFDPSKGMDKAMEMGVSTRQKMRAAGVPDDQLPEVVIVGNGSVDDPDGPGMFEEMLRVRRQQSTQEKDGIIIMRLKHNYDAMNALMRRSNILMQTSVAEGLETRVSDAIMHGKPVVVSNRGGMKTQVIEGESGVVLDYDKAGYDLEKGANFMSELLMNPDAYETMVESTKKLAESFNSREFTTTANVTRWLRIFNNLQTGIPADKVWHMSELA